MPVVPLAPVAFTPDTRKLVEAGVKTTETTPWKKVTIGVDRRQDEARPSQIRPYPVALPSEREGGDDWFTMFDVTREKPVVVPPGSHDLPLKALHTPKIMHLFINLNCEHQKF